MAEESASSIAVFDPVGAKHPRPYIEVALTCPVHKVTSFEIAGPHRLRVEFADGLSRTIDFRPVLEGELYGPRRDLRVFNAVSLDPEVHTLVWPNGADFGPATLRLAGARGGDGGPGEAVGHLGGFR